VEIEDNTATPIEASVDWEAKIRKDIMAIAEKVTDPEGYVSISQLASNIPKWNQNEVGHKNLVGAARKRAQSYAKLEVDQPHEVTNEPEQLDQSGQGTLEGVSTDQISGARKSGDAGTSSERGGRDDVQGNVGTGGERVSEPRSVGDGKGTVSVSEGGTRTGGRSGSKSGSNHASGSREDTESTSAGSGSGFGSVYVTPAKDLAENFIITPDAEIGAGGAKTKFKNNITAIRLLKILQREGRAATRDEQSVLAKYVGWGGIPQAFYKDHDQVTKGWEKEAAELKALLTDEEYEAASRSTQDAHYTSTEIVSGIWEAVQGFGFKGGRVLEPSVGVGNFLGLVPESLRESAHFTGVELDTITSGIAKQLYPHAHILEATGFQDLTSPDGFYDLAIGNPPFGNQKLYDGKRKHLSKFSIHNYFFGKSVDLLKPNGVLAMVVSNYMMDAGNTSARAYLAKHTELLGAIRLPNNAFLKNAGTEVTTDIIFLRKLRDGEQPTGPKWLDLKTIPDPTGKDDIPINEYFAEHPENMLGEMGRVGTMYAPDTPALTAKQGQDTAVLLSEAVARITEKAFMDVPGEAPKAEKVEVARDVEDVRVGSMFVKDGEVYIRTEDIENVPQAEKVEFTRKFKGELRPDKKGADRVRRMIDVRDALAKLRKAQLQEDVKAGQLKMLRTALNRVYDDFVKKFGPINQDANKRLFRDDPTWPQIAALEEDFDKGVSATVAKRTGEKPRKPSASKAAIFSKRTQSPYKPVDSANTAKDALVASLSERGSVDLEYMSEIYDKSKLQIIDELRGLILKNPIGGWETREQYLSGNVKKKLAIAEEAAKSDSTYQDNVEALRTVQPADIEAVDINVKVGAHWLPPEVMGDFVDHITGGAGGKAFYSNLTAKWSIQSKRASSDKATQWGTNRRTPVELLVDIANQKATIVRDTVGYGADKKTVLNESATNAAQEKAEQIKAEWNRWIWQDDARREQLSRIYNDTFNTDVIRDFDGSHLSFPGKVSDDIIKFRPHQGNAVWRIIQGEPTLLDHVVGAGKTFTVIGAVMEMRRLGLANKPVIVVPNHLVGQWAEDFIKLYPGANILAATKKDFEKTNRKKLFARISTGDWDAVIVAHSSFGKVEVEPEYQAQFIKQQVKDLDSAIAAIKEAEGGKGRSIKEAEKQKERLQEKLERLFDAENKDDSLYFGELGIDALFLDEAHEFKNLAFATSMTRVAGLGNQKGSQKAADMFMKTQYVLDKTGGRNVVFATGTPISNTMAEMYTMQRYLSYGTLKHKGLAHFDAWARQFGEVVTDWELSPSGKYKLNSRFAKFVNMPELMQDYLRVADVINRDDINRMLAAQGKTLPVPKIKGGKPQNIVVDRSPEQAIYIGEPIKDEDGNDTDKYPDGTLVWRSENLPKGPPKKGDDNMLKIMSDARKAALDMRMISPEYGDYEGSKVNEAADRILNLYQKWDADNGTQLVFIDLSTPKSAKTKDAAEIKALIDRAEEGDEVAEAALEKLSPDDLLALEGGNFSVYDDLREKLIQRGIPDNEIAYIHQANTEQQKEDLFGKVRTGRVRVLFGSTAKMGAGMNVQERLVGLHHMDAPWRPSDLEQREGRIIRQGNKLYDRDPDGFEIEILRYATKQTLDSRMWQTIEGKARFIEQVRKGNLLTREVEDVAGEAANAAEMKAASSGNPLILEEMELRTKLRKLEGLQAEHDRQQFRIRDSMRHNEQVIKFQKQRIADFKEDIKSRDANRSKKFQITLDDKVYEKRKAAGSKIILAAAEMKKERKPTRKLGQYQGFKLTLEDMGKQSFAVNIKGAGDYQVDVLDITEASPDGLTVRIGNVVSGFDKETEKAEMWLKEAQDAIPGLQEQIGQWDKADELQQVRKRHTEVVNELKPKKKEADTEEKSEEKPKFSRRSAPKKSHLSSEELDSVIDRITRSWKGGPDVVALDNFSGLPEEIQQAAKEQGAGSHDVHGVSYRGKVYVIRYMMTSATDVERVLFHEAYGHYGLAKLFSEDLVRKLNQIYLGIGGSNGLSRLAKKHAVDITGYAKGTKKLDIETRRAILMEELLAHIAQDSKPTIARKVKEVFGAIRQWLRNHGLVNLGELSDSEIMYLLKQSRQSVKTGKLGKGLNNEVRFMRMRRGKSDRTSDALKEKLGLAQKKSGYRKFVEFIRNTDFGDLNRHMEDEFTQGALDRFFGIKRAEEKYAGKIDASQSGYIASRLSTGLSSIITATLHYGTPKWREGILQKIPYSKGLLEIFEPVGDEINDWLVWMAGKRAARLMAEGRERNLNKDDIAEALALDEGREDRFKKVSDEYAKFMSRILDVAEQAGLINPEGRKMWEHADYVPFYRMSVDDMFRGAKGPTSRKGLSHQSAGIRMLRGGEVATNDLLENIVMNVTHLLDASMKNNALGKTLRILKDTGVYEDATMEFRKELISMSQVKDMIKRQFEAEGWTEESIEQYLDMMPKEVISGLRNMWAMKPPQDPDVVRVMINGKARYYRVKDPLLLRAMTQVNTEKSRFLPMEIARSFKRVLTATVTASPEFMLRNFIRDAAHAWTISDDNFMPLVDSTRGAMKTIKLWSKDVDHEAVGGAVDMMFAGGSFLGGYIHGNDPTQTAAAIRGALRKRGYSAASANEFMASLIDTPAKFWERYREFGDAIENASREAVFEAAMRSGKSKAQAIFEAKDLMDYSMQGQWALFQALGDVVPFFNARLQGLYKLKRAGAIPGWASKSKVLAKGGVIAAISLALLALNWDDERYEDLPDWDKDLYWHFFVGDEHLRVPKPFEVGVMYGTIPERMARYFGDKDDEKRAMKQLLWNIRESLNLVQMPQIAKPVAELWANKDTFTGMDIEGMADEGKLKSARYNEHTSLTMRKLGEAFGDELDLSPKQMEHLWRGYLGTLGMYALGATDLAVHWATDAPTKPDYRPDQLPVIKSFYRGSEPARTTRYKTEMYEMLRELEQINRTIRSYAKQGRIEDAKALKEESSGKLKALGPLRVGAKGAKAIRIRIDRIIRDEDMPGDEKREKINELYEKSNKLTKKMVEKAYPDYIKD
jgi:N12 class adenine-specific DNA methylase